MTTALDVSAFAPWIGRTEESEDLVTPHAVRGMRAIFDDDAPVKEGDALPPAWHWMFNNPVAPQSRLGRDGHPKRGGFVPPIELPRRMWTGSEVTFEAPIRVGDRIRRLSRIESLTPKSGSTGTLVFLMVRHEVTSSSGGRTVDLQRIVYREDPAPGAPQPKAEPAKHAAEFSMRMEPDPVMLFRFSALTFNGHRIHYDRVYATQVEGYPGLVVHGPLIATLLLDLLHRNEPHAEVAAFSFKALRPTFDLHPFAVHGRREGAGVRLWAQDHEGWLTMDAQATLR